MKPKLTKEEKEERARCNRIRSMLRRAWSRDPQRFEALKKAKRVYKGDNPRQRFEYKCAVCRKYFKQSDVSVDHIVPVGSYLKREQLGEWADRLFYGELQVLCSKCHNFKTQTERLERKINDHNI